MTSMGWSVADMAQAVSNARLIGDAAVRVQRVHTDTRSLEIGDAFLAIAGDNHDGNAKLAEAKAKGAVAAIAHARATDGLAAVGLSGIEVPDTRKALGELSRAWRRRFSGPLIAVTGSNGKTTVTQMIASILRAHAGEGAHATRNSFNNDIGLPLTLLGLREHHSHAVVEIGMNHPGEISALAALAAPTVALVNNAQREHQEFMGTVEAVARENASVFALTAKAGIAIFPAQDAYTALWKSLALSAGLITKTFGPGGDFSVDTQLIAGAQTLRVHTPGGVAQATLRMPGAHNASNALAAAACAFAAGVPLSAIEQGLDNFVAVTGRSRWVPLNGALAALTLIDDSYNANPDSVRAAVDVLASLPAPQAMLLGDMGEVGEQGPAFHAEVGTYAASRGIAQLWVCGSLAEHAARAYTSSGGASARIFSTVEDTLEALPRHLSVQGSLLIKGSRFMRMERLVKAVEAMDRKAPSAHHKDSHAA